MMTHVHTWAYIGLGIITVLVGMLAILLVIDLRTHAARRMRHFMETGEDFDDG
jgi:hypothetical protein